MKKIGLFVMMIFLISVIYTGCGQQASDSNKSLGAQDSTKSPINQGVQSKIIQNAPETKPANPSQMLGENTKPTVENPAMSISNMAPKNQEQKIKEQKTGK